MSGKVCANCGQNFLLSYCPNPSCRQWREQQTKEKANQLFKELREINNEFDEKTKDAYLSVVDVKKYLKLKSETNKLIQQKGRTENWDEYWMAEADFNLLKKSIEKLDETIKNNASPQTIDIAKNKKRPNSRCFHKKIESCTDDSTWYCCSYCWEQEDKKFLWNLQTHYLENIRSSCLKHNLDASRFSDFKDTANLLELLGFRNFSKQEDIRNAYQKINEEFAQIIEKKSGKKENIENSNQGEEDNEPLTHQELDEIEQLIKEIENLKNNPRPNNIEWTTYLKAKEDRLKELEKRKNKPKRNKNNDPSKKPKNNPSVPSSNSLSENNDKTFEYAPWLIGGGCFILFILLLLFLIKKRKK